MRNDEYAKREASGSESGHGRAGEDAEGEAGGDPGGLWRERDDGAAVCRFLRGEVFHADELGGESATGEQARWGDGQASGYELGGSDAGAWESRQRGRVEHRDRKRGPLGGVQFEAGGVGG